MNPKINRYCTPDGFVFYEYLCMGGNLLADSIASLVKQIKDVYGLDYSLYIFELN